MKLLYSFLIGTMFLNTYGCDKKVEESDIPVERQEDYESPSDTRTDDELEIDRDVLGDDEIELND